MFTLPAGAQTMIGPVAPEARLGARRPHPALVVGCNRLDLVGAQTEEPERSIDRDVALGTDEDADAWSALEAAAGEIPAGALELVVPCRCERGHMGHLTAGDEACRDAGGQHEELAQPVQADLLDNGRARPGDDEPGVLIPGRGEPVGSQRGGQRAADHEAEVAATAGGDHARLGGGDQLCDHLLGLGRPFGKRSRKALTQLLDRRSRRNRPLRQRAEVLGRVVGGEPQQLVVRHDAHATAERTEPLRASFDVAYGRQSAPR